MIVKEYNVELVALQDVRWPGFGHLKLYNMTIFYTESKNGRYEYGVGFMINLV